MEKNLIEQISLPTDTMSNQQSAQDIVASPEDTLKINLVDVTEGEVERTFQRRPQFRFSENNKRRFF